MKNIVCYSLQKQLALVFIQQLFFSYVTALDVGGQQFYLKSLLMTTVIFLEDKKKQQIIKSAWNIFVHKVFHTWIFDECVLTCSY